MNYSWYQFEIGNDEEAIKNRLSELSIDYVVLTDICYPNPSFQKIFSRIGCCLFVKADMSQCGWLFTNNNKQAGYSDREISNIIGFLSNYNGELKIEHNIPSKAKECTILYLKLKHVRGFFIPVKKRDISKFYMKLFNDIIISMPIPNKCIFV